MSVSENYNLHWCPWDISSHGSIPEKVANVQWILTFGGGQTILIWFDIFVVY